MLGEVESLEFFLFTYSQTEDSLDDTEYDKHHYRCPGCDRRKADQLCTQKIKSSAVEKTDQRVVAGCARGCKKSDCYGTPDTVHHMYCNCADRIVDMQLVVEEPYSEDDQESCNGSDSD